MTAIHNGEPSGERPAVLPSSDHYDIDSFLQGWLGVAALLINRQLTVLSLSTLAEELFPTLRPGQNLAHEVFLGECAPDERGSTETFSTQLVAMLQTSIGRNDDAELRHIVGELSTRSREFSTAFAHGSEPVQPSGMLRVQHPALGWMSLRYQLLRLGAEVDGTLIVWQGSDPHSVRALDQLVQRPRRLSSEI